MPRINYKKNVRIEITQKIQTPGTFSYFDRHWQENHQAEHTVAVSKEAEKMAYDIIQQIKRHVDVEDGHVTVMYEAVNACGFCLDESVIVDDRIPPCCDEAQKEWLVAHTAEQAAEQDRLQDYGTIYQDYRLELLAAATEEEKTA